MIKFTNLITIITTCILFAACSQKENNNNSNRKIQRGEYTLVGNIDKDSSLHGTINYYNKDSVLVSKQDFTDNINNGPSINYYLNGAKKNETQFFYGKENGYTYSFDSVSGKITYKNYYYYGKLIGPNYYYYPDGKIQEYYFYNFESKTVFYSSYDSLGKPENMTDGFFQMNISDVVEDDRKKWNLFLYNIQPPHFWFNYKICVEDSNKKIIYFVDSVSKEKVFYERLLPPMTNGNKYCIVLTITDSVSNEKHTFIKEILKK